MYKNVRGLRTKIQFFRNCAINLQCDLLFLSETWLNNDIIIDIKVGLVDYNIFRVDKIFNMCLCVRGSGFIGF